MPGLFVSRVAVEGIPETVAALQEFTDVNVPRTMRAGVRNGARIMREAMRGTASFQSHGRTPGRASGGLVSTIAYRPSTKRVGPYGYLIGPQGKSAFYAPWVIQGHEIRHKPHGPSAGRTRPNDFVAMGDVASRGAALEAIAAAFREAIAAAGVL